MKRIEHIVQLIENHDLYFSTELERNRDRLERLWLKNDQSCLRDGSMLPRASINSRRNVMVRWLCSTWCNYTCPYCFQDSHRRLKDSHCFDVFPVSKWIESFHRHFEDRGLNLSLVISGGEPTLDARNMSILLDELCRADYLLNVRIDTNGSWNKAFFDRIKRKDKIWLNCSFHPSRAKPNTFLHQIDEFRQAGYNIGMINFVLSTESRLQFEELRVRLPDGIPLNPNPRVDCDCDCDNETTQVFKSCLPREDYEHKYEKVSPLGRQCLHPAVAYQMGPNGAVSIACHEWLMKNFVMDAELPPLFATYISCPKMHCMCSDMYSFQKGCGRNFDLNPLYSYKNELLQQARLAAVAATHYEQG